MVFEAELEVVNSALAELVFVGERDYFGPEAAVRIHVSDNSFSGGLDSSSPERPTGDSFNAATPHASTALVGVDSHVIPITVRPINDPPEPVVPVNEFGVAGTHYVDEEESIHITGVTHIPLQELPPSFEYIASTGAELFRTEGIRPSYDTGEWGERTAAAGGIEGLATTGLAAVTGARHTPRA